MIRKHATYYYRRSIRVCACLSSSTARLIPTHTVEWIIQFRDQNYPVWPGRDFVGLLFYTLKYMEIAKIFHIDQHFSAPMQNESWMSCDCAGSIIYVCHVWEEKLRYHLCPCCRALCFFPRFSMISALFSSVLCLASCLVYRCFYFVIACTFCIFNHATTYPGYSCSACFFFVLRLMSDVLVQTS